ncbi:hypothetical protein B0H13DRAFT_1915899 [Mycena leptocephala]|nr:hypothetical protein B0H13DRAFT_1915899 [Mycena leptocephala]
MFWLWLGLKAMALTGLFLALAPKKSAARPKAKPSQAQALPESHNRKPWLLAGFGTKSQAAKSQPRPDFWHGFGPGPKACSFLARGQSQNFTKQVDQMARV